MKHKNTIYTYPYGRAHRMSYWDRNTQIGNILTNFDFFRAVESRATNGMKHATEASKW